MIVQCAATATEGGQALDDISFTPPKTDGPMEALRAVQERVGFRELLYDSAIGKISIVGAGMRSAPGVAARFFDALAEVGVNIGRARVFPDQPDVAPGSPPHCSVFAATRPPGGCRCRGPGAVGVQVCAIGPMVTNRDPGMRSQPLADRLTGILCQDYVN